MASGAWRAGYCGQALVHVLAGGVITFFRDHFYAGPIYADFNLAEFAIDDRLVAGVDERVLGSRLFSDLGIASFNAAQIAFRVERSACAQDISGETIVVHGEGQMEAAHVAFAPARGVAHRCSVDGNLVGLQVAQDVFVGCLAAVFLAIGDDIDDATAALGACGQFFGSGKNRVVESMDFFGNGDEGSVAGGASFLEVGVDATAVLADVATGEWTRVDGHKLFAAGLFGQGQHGGQAAALRAGEAGALLRPVVVGEDRNFVVGRECALDCAEGVVHLGHDVCGETLVNDERDRKSRRFNGEDPQRLARVVFEYLEVAPGKAGNQLSLRIFDRDRNFDEGDVEGEPCADVFRVQRLRRRTLNGVSDLAGRGL